MRNGKLHKPFSFRGRRICEAKTEKLLYFHFFLCPVLQGFQHTVLIQQLFACQIGHGAGHPEDAVVGAGRKAQRLVGGPQELFSSGGHPADAPHLPGGELGVAADLGADVGDALDLGAEGFVPRTKAQKGQSWYLVQNDGGERIVVQAGDLDLPTTMAATASPAFEVATIPEASLRDAVDDYQRRLIGAALAEFGGNWSQAARRLGVDRANLQRLVKRLGW